MSRHRPRKGIELYRDDDAFTVLVDLAEFERDDVGVSWREGRLHVTAERLDEDGRVDHRHRHLGVPTDVATEDIAAEFADGVLEVTLPIQGAPEPNHRPVEVS
jgi:HSP20 family protein